MEASQRQARKAARAYIYEEWSKPQSPRDLGMELKTVRSAFEECKKVRDLVGPKKLLDETVKHGERLAKEESKLNAANDDDEKQIEVIRDVAASLGKLVQDVDKYLKMAVGTDKK